MIAAGRKIEQFEIENYTPLVAEAERLEFTHEAALGQGKGPLDKLVKKVSLQHAGGSSSADRTA